MSSSSSGFCRSFARAWTTSTHHRPAASQQRAAAASAAAAPLFGGSAAGRRVPLLPYSFRGGSMSHTTRLYATVEESSTTNKNQDSSSSNNDNEDTSNLLSALTTPKLTTKSFGGLSYMDTSGNNDDFFRVLFVLGGPGAGKGTQSELMEQHYPVVHLSVGELLRNVKPDSPHAALIEQTLVQGKIVPVEISLSLLQDAMREQRSSRGEQLIYLVDGFPRNQDNLDGWCRVMKDCAVLWGVLLYTCPLAVLEERILKRAADSGRSDDNLDSLRHRFKTFETQTMPIVEQLSQVESSEWSVLDIHGDQSLDDVWLETQHIMNQLILHDVVSSNVALLEAIQTGNVQAYVDLCDEEWFDGKDAAAVMAQQEGDAAIELDSIERAQLDVISGTHVALSYDRPMKGEIVREKRIWTHQGKGGWRNVHFSRTPKSS